MTKEQAIFYVSLKKIEALEKQEPKDQKQIDQYKTYLWEVIYKFAKSEINSLMGEFTSKEEREDVLQSVALIFFEKLPYYNPLQTTPTTYFVRFFKQEISKHIRSYHKRLTQYDATNARKISNVVTEYEKKGIRPTLDVIARKSGLSQKVIKSTLLYSSNSQIASVEESYTLSSDIPTPEQFLTKCEQQRILAETLKNNTTQLERKLLMMRVNPNGSKLMPYDKIAEEMNMPIREVKQIINRTICRMNQDRKLRSAFGHENIYQKVTPVFMQDNAAQVMENQLAQFLSCTAIKELTENVS